MTIVLFKDTLINDMFDLAHMLAGVCCLSNRPRYHTEREMGTAIAFLPHYIFQVEIRRFYLRQTFNNKARKVLTISPLGNLFEMIGSKELEFLLLFHRQPTSSSI